MGLDMYLYKAKKLKEGITAREITTIDSFLNWKETGQGYSLKDWCGLEEKEMDLDVVNLYKKEQIKHFFSWGLEKKFSYVSILKMVGDWRKANAIHRWFVENVQDGVDDCGSYEVSEEQIKQLLENCYSVLASKKSGVLDIDTAEKLLPTMEGFFFGSTEYDEDYLFDIENTIDILEDVLKTTDFKNEMIIYITSW